jgi:hypothetical protein
MSLIHEKIKARAYGLFLERNGNGGSQIEDWLNAEKELGKEMVRPAEEVIIPQKTAIKTTAARK